MRGALSVRERASKRIAARSSSAEGAARCYFPRDLFFCFFTFKLTIGAFTPVPRETGLGTACFFDFPSMPTLLDRGGVATRRSHATGRARGPRPLADGDRAARKLGHRREATRL